MRSHPDAWTEEELLETLRVRGAPSLEKLRFRENRRTIWSITGGGRRLNLHAAYRRAPVEILLEFVVLVREVTGGDRRGPAYRRAAGVVRGWPGLGPGLERARRRSRASTGVSARGRGRSARAARPGPCCATPDQRRWLAAFYRHLAGSRFGGDLPLEVPVRLSRRMTSRLGHMRGGWEKGLLRRRRVVEIALSLDLMLPGNEEELLDTLLHEMAHASDWLQRGGRGHGRAWKDVARRVGCSDRAGCQAPLRRRRRAGDAVTAVPDVSPDVFADRVAGEGRAPVARHTDRRA